MTEEFKAALGAAIGKLRKKDCFESEIREAIGADKSLADQVVDYLRKRRILDDDRLIANFVAHYSDSKQKGPEWIREKLLTRGAKLEAVDLALSGIQPQALALLQEKFACTTDRGKAARFLHGRGFTEAQIESAIDQHFGNMNE